jgi:hypothetical protein
MKVQDCGELIRGAYQNRSGVVDDQNRRSVGDFTGAANESWTIGFQFVVVSSIQNIESALSENHRPVAVGIPGYVLPKDIHAQLFLRYSEPVKSIEAEPAGAIDIQKKDEVENRAFTEYALTGKQ